MGYPVIIHRKTIMKYFSGSRHAITGHMMACLLTAGTLIYTPTVSAQTIEPLPFTMPQAEQTTTGESITSPLKASDAILRLDARMIENGAPLTSGLVWRIFSREIGLDDKLPLLATKEGGSAEFRLPTGDYLIHAAFGRAGITKRLTVEGGKNYYESMVLNAGGLELNAILPNGKINESRVKFSIFADDSENPEHSLIIPNVKPHTIVRLNAGLYHIVSNYGSANATVRSDIRVDAGKLTEATLQHHAAQITLKLVRQEGGEALADTSWAIINDSGDTVREVANAYVYMVLAEGDYVAVAKNKDQLYQKEFSVTSGKDEEIDVLAIPQNAADDDGPMD